MSYGVQYYSKASEFGAGEGAAAFLIAAIKFLKSFEVEQGPQGRLNAHSECALRNPFELLLDILVAETENEIIVSEGGRGGGNIVEGAILDLFQSVIHKAQNCTSTSLSLKALVEKQADKFNHLNDSYLRHYQVDIFKKMLNLASTIETKDHSTKPMQQKNHPSTGRDSLGGQGQGSTGQNLLKRGKFILHPFTRILPVRAQRPSISTTPPAFTQEDTTTTVAIAKTNTTVVGDLETSSIMPPEKKARNSAPAEILQGSK